jgi:hypothetical protein
MKNLAEKGMIVNVVIGQWSGRKDDKQVAKDVEAQHHTTNAGRYLKNLIDEKQLKVIHQASSAIRKFVAEQTMPWGDNGDRLLPAVHHLDFLKEYRDLQADFQDAVSDFLLEYPILVTDAQRTLKTLFRATDYPSLAQMKNKFKLHLSVQPIANLDDFRLEVDPTELEQLRTRMEQEFYQRITEATRDIWERIRNAVGRVAAKLSEKEPKFHDSLVTHIGDLVELLPKLNITGDPDITQAVNSMKSLVVDPRNLRTNEVFRSQKAKQAQAIMDKFDSYMN